MENWEETLSLKIKTMENKRKNENELREQEAPLKNTDKAFVKVSKEGHPEFPEAHEDGNRVPKEVHQNKNDEKQ
jgi:hypothetical protein